MNTTADSYTDVMNKWEQIIAIEAILNDNVANDAYYDIQADLNKKLVAFLRLNFRYLTTNQLLKLCDLVQRHRPVALHSFLITCGNLVNNHQK